EGGRIDGLVVFQQGRQRLPRLRAPDADGVVTGDRDDMKAVGAARPRFGGPRQTHDCLNLPRGEVPDAEGGVKTGNNHPAVIWREKGNCADIPGVDPDRLAEELARV